MSVQSILFVCLGNICRSPLAEGIAKREFGEDVEIDSCGTGGYHVGEPPCENSVRIASQKGVDISKQQARRVNPLDGDRFEVIVAMDAQNLADLKHLFPNHPRIYKLGDFGRDGEDVPDPYFFRGFEGFEKVYAMIEECIRELKQKI